MSSPEILILSITALIACITYLVKHFKKSSCLSKESCCTCKMDKDDSVKSEVVIQDESIKPQMVISSVV